ncbi:MAG: hypothetical protein ACM3ZE_29830, partial [Myxococcales bacterium]
MNKSITAIALVAVASGCAFADNGTHDGFEKVGTAEQATTLGASGRSVPYPVVRELTDSGEIVDQIDPTTQKPRTAWDGTYTELLIADEYAKCVSEVSGLDVPYVEFEDAYPNLADSGPALERVQLSIHSGTCPRSQYRSGGTIRYPVDAIEWALRRADPLCNVDPSTGEHRAALELPQLDAKSVLGSLVRWQKGYPEKVPPVPGHAGFTLAPSMDPITVEEAYNFVYRGNIGVCFAQRLNELLESPEAFTVSSQEHMLLLGLVQERAQDAMMKLGYLLKLSQRDAQDIPTSNLGGDASVGSNTGAYLRFWLDSTNAAPISAIRNAFLRAVALATAGTTALASYLERQAGARWTSAANATGFERDWGARSARGRLMNLVFGGGALVDLWNLESDWVMDGWFSPVEGATNDPVVQVLFDLARQGDALYFHKITDLSGTTLDPLSWETLYLETELGLRTRQCRNQDPTQCTREALRPALPSPSDPNAFRLKTVYGITLEHAKQLSQMLYAAAVREDFIPGSITQRPLFGTFHLSGVHSESPPGNRIGETGWIKLDKDTVLFQYALEDRAQWGSTVCSPSVPTWDHFGYCTSVFLNEPEKHSRLGALSALAFAREVLFQQSAVSDPQSDSEIAAALKSVERLTGRTTAIRRQDSVELIQPEANEAPVLVNMLGVGSSPGLRTSAKDPKYVAANGLTDRKKLDETAGIPFQARSTGVHAASRLAKMTWVGAIGNPWPGNSALLLRSNDGSSTKYTFLSETRPKAPFRYVDPTSAVSTEGWFVDLVQRNTAVESTNWSEPEYDGFGVPRHWVPPADASLMGGTVGEESYQYLLRSARSAAEEATSAVKTAIDKLAEEASDSAALRAAETRASAIASIEREGLCGATSDCEFSIQMVDLSFPNNSNPCSQVPSDGVGTCKQLISVYDSRIPPVELPEPVVTALQTKSERYTAAEYGGTELQKVLLRIWNAARLLQETRDQAAKLAVAAGHEKAAGVAAVNSAAAEYEAIDAALKVPEATLELQLRMALDTAQNTVNAANQEVALKSSGASDGCFYFTSICFALCNNASCSELREICPSSPLGMRESFEHCATAKCYSHEGGIPAGEAQIAQCQAVAGIYMDAVIQKDLAEANLNSLRQTFSTYFHDDTDYGEKTAQLASASARKTAAQLQNGRNLSQSEVQSSTQLSVIEQAVGELKAAVVEWRQLKTRLRESVTRADLESKLARDSMDSSVGIRRKYRSYDLWRARALLESARRLANAARRSIEARFVVELSTLQTEQAFVSSPSTWVDEVYESDLDAPAVVGLSQAPRIEGTIYPNKLVDYVGNLERFVQGYTVTYPTSISLPDTEVITLGAPEQVRKAVDGAGTLSPDVTGWRFYCANMDTWIAHPGLGQLPLTQRLDTACNGRAPTLARIGFLLDPWGSLNGAWTRPQYTDRHNVRWRRLAVNLVGTGIRDCSKSTDSMSCYTNPYVRFNLLHAGPSWQTNYSGEWRALDISTASIEGGKALAAEEWLEPVTNSWNMPYVSNVARGELFGRPAAGNYELVLEITPDVRLDRIERIQLLVEQDYWVKQNGGRGVYETTQVPSTGSGGSTGTGTSTSMPSSGGTTGSGGGTGG